MRILLIFNDLHVAAWSNNELTYRSNKCYKAFFIPLEAAAQPVKRRVERKRKATADIEAEAEEHQKRREVQYQNLLAPSIQMSPSGTAANAVIDEPSSSQFSLPSLPDVEKTHPLHDQTPLHTEQDVSSFPDPSRVISEMANMGYDQVSTVLYVCLKLNFTLSVFIINALCYNI